MVIKGASRGNAAQLADYLLDKGNNEEIRVFGTYGTSSIGDLRESIIEMGRFEEVTRSRNPIFHSIIRPSHKESLEMTDDQWLHSIATLQKNLGFDYLPWAAMEHRDDDGKHMHICFQKYDPATGKMRTDRHTHHKNDDTREALEIEFNHPRTPRRNLDRPILMKNVVEAWKSAKNGREFIENCKKYGYTIAYSKARHPYLIIDEKGRSFNLMKKLTNKEEKFSVRTKVMRAAMDGIELPLDKDVFKQIKAQKAVYNKAEENKELFEDMGKAEFKKKFMERRQKKRGR